MLKDSQNHQQKSGLWTKLSNRFFLKFLMVINPLCEATFCKLQKLAAIGTFTD